MDCVLSGKTESERRESDEYVMNIGKPPAWALKEKTDGGDCYLCSEKHLGLLGNEKREISNTHVLKLKRATIRVT